MKTLYIIRSLSACVLMCIFTGCYYDKEEILYSNIGCDTANVTYARSVAPVINISCNSCHSGNTPSGGIRLDDHASLTAQVNRGKIPGVIEHSPGFSPMPQNAPKLSDCNIAIIKKWIANGSPNN